MLKSRIVFSGVSGDQSRAKRRLNIGLNKCWSVSAGCVNGYLTFYYTNPLSSSFPNLVTVTRHSRYVDKLWINPLSKSQSDVHAAAVRVI